MAAIDAVLSHRVGYQDIILSSRNIYGGSYQLLHDWYGKKSNLDVAVCWFDGSTVDAFKKSLRRVETEHKNRPAQGRRVYVFLESPGNPHGYVLDVPGICRAAHEKGMIVICDSTIGMPVLQPVLRREDPMERPDFVIHRERRRLWARQVFEVDPLRCHFGGTMRVVVLILGPAVIRKILQHRPRSEPRAHVPPPG